MGADSRLLALLLLGCTPAAPPAAEGYAGSESCAPCHPAEHARWRESLHARNMVRPSAETVVAPFPAVYEYAGTRSEMRRTGDAWEMVYTDPDGRTETLSINYVLGVARHQAFVHREPDGRLQVLPTWWNVPEARWQDSREGPVDGPTPLPTDDPAYWRNYRRTFNRACLECHGSQPDKRYDAESGRYDSRFDPAINCEACHGPGAAHNEAWRTLRPEAGGSADKVKGLVRFGELGLEQRIEVCAACHAGKRVYADGYQPGDPFFDYFAPEVWQAGMFYADGRSSSLTYRYVEYMQNRCFRGPEGARMDCGYCHPPHDPPAAPQTVKQINAMCTGCHREHAVRLEAHTHHPPESEGSRCVECHMPRVALDLRMTVHDHTIGSPLPLLTTRHGAPNACGNCHAQEGPEWAQRHVDTWFGERPRYRAWRDRMLERAEVLSAVFGGGPVPVATLSRWLDDPSRSVIERASAARFLGDAAQDPATCATLRRHLDDTHPLVRFYVVDALPRCRDLAALRAALTDARRVVRVRAYEALRVLAPEVEGDPALAGVRAEYLARRAGPRVDDPRDLSDEALLQFSRGDAPEAERLLRRAVALTWPVPAARGDLAQLLIRLGRLADAEAEVRALEARWPESNTALLTRGVLLLKRGRRLEARAYFDRLVAKGYRIPVVLDGQRAAWEGR